MHRNKKIRLGRKTAQRKALVRGMLSDLVLHGKMTTTATRAKYITSEFDELIAGTKRQKEQHQKIRFLKKTLFNTAAQKKFYQEILPGTSDRNSGYTRTTLLGPRKGDAAPMIHIEILL